MIVDGRATSSFAYRLYASIFGDPSFRITLRQLVSALGLTHASSVTPLVRCSAATSLIVTQLLTPLNNRPPPTRPDAQDAPESVPLFPFPEMSAATVPEPSLNPYAATRPPSGRMVTVMPALAVSRLPLSSNARARSVAELFAEPGPAGVQL